MRTGLERAHKASARRVQWQKANVPTEALHVEAKTRFGAFSQAELTQRTLRTNSSSTNPLRPRQPVGYSNEDIFSAEIVWAQEEELLTALHASQSAASHLRRDSPIPCRRTVGRSQGRALRGYRQRYVQARDNQRPDIIGPVSRSEDEAHWAESRRAAYSLCGGESVRVAFRVERRRSSWFGNSANKVLS